MLALSPVMCDRQGMSEPVIPNVLSAEDVTGPYDVIVRAEARTLDDLSRQVLIKIQHVDGITRTITCSVVHL